MSPSQLNRRSLFASGLAAGLAVPLLSRAQAAAFDPGFVDHEAERFRAAFEIPGYGVAVVGAGAEPFLKGYGVRTMGRPERIDAHTRFAIASNTKAYTAAAIAILVDEGRLGWDEPVIRYLPEFRMYDPAVTQMMSVRDLLCHRSGLPLGAGDLLFFPDTTHTAEDALKALAYLKPARPFRGGYAYDNILYTVAGILIARVSGGSWADFIATRLLAPIGETDAAPSLDWLHADNVAGRHGRRGGAFVGRGPMTIVQPQGEHGDAIQAAGGIQASVSDQAKWIATQLAHGVTPGGKRLWSEAQADAMWAPQVITGVSDGPTPDNPGRPVQRSYALGWGVQDYRGERLISHSGGLNGQITQTALLPRRKLGVVVFSNAEGQSTAYLRNAILDHLLGAPAFDWVEACRKASARDEAEAIAHADHDVTTPPAGGPSLPLDAYVGRYRDPWYGDVIVSRQGAGLAIAFLPTPSFKSVLQPWGPDSFRTHFAPGVGEDALVTFVAAKGRVERIAMKAFSPLADFSYDFHHLDFRPVT